MIIAATGHRPDKLPNKEIGYTLPNPTYNYVYREIEKILLKYNPEKCISGMALGTDQYFAAVCVRLKIPFIAAVPFLGQESMWNTKTQQTYQKLLQRASEVVIVSPGSYSAAKMQIRNEYMVDHCDLLIGVFDGTSGGTKNCLDYAKSKNKEIIIIDPKLASK